ncbi:MAG TPA: FixH family protein [Polyangia bacterium]|nr:FixH family protein [Polyangia bacterium]
MFVRALGLSMTLALVGCGPAMTGDAAPAPSFSDAPLETVTSTSGGVRIALRWSPSVPVRGENAAQLTFVDGLGQEIDGLTVDVVPWMPAHGHGTSVQPVTTATEPGVVVATPLYLYMSGAWQLRLTISGALEASAVATVQIP